MTVATIRAGIAAALDTIAGLRVSAYVVDQVNPPHAMVMRREFTYDTVQQTGTYDGVFVVRVFASRTAEKAAQVFLDGLVDPTGVKAAVEADPTLGGAVSDCWVRSVAEIVSVTVGDIDYLAIDFELRVTV